jgi:CubicO group peptidase (beta-lactamase class C family)
VIRIQKGRTKLYQAAFGVVNLQSREPVTTDTVFDVASLTKPLATTLAVLLLIQSGRLALDQPMGSIISALKGTEKQKIEVQHLLRHTSGLPDHRPYYKQLVSLPHIDSREQLNRFLTAEPLTHRIGEQMVYSDIGFMLLRWVVETVSGMRLDRFVSEMIYRPLGIEALYYIDSTKVCPERRFAATQWCPRQGRFLEGMVSDENALAAGGVDGHAGLFGTATAVGDLLGELMAVYRGEPNKGLFQTKWVKRFFRRDEYSGRALGFDMPTPGVSSSGRYFSEKTIGHLGFTGTSFWSDLNTTTSIILLTNRVHPSIENDKIKAFRPVVHDTVMTCMGAHNFCLS